MWSESQNAFETTARRDSAHIGRLFDAEMDLSVDTHPGPSRWILSQSDLTRELCKFPLFARAVCCGLADLRGIAFDVVPVFVVSATAI